jgi:hypothetical protein
MSPHCISGPLLDSQASLLALEKLFARRPIADLAALMRELGTRSRMSVFRRLSAFGYLSSYTHTGRYYALTSVADFDAEGLWRFEGVGFSRDGTLKATVLRMVTASEAGRTQRELQLRLGVRVHNPLLALVEQKQLGREPVDDEFVYVTAHRKRAAEQLGRRRELALVPAATPQPALEAEVLLEVIHGVRAPPQDAATLAARLGARGIRASVAEVAMVLDRHGIKKTPQYRSRRSKR